MPNAPDVIHEEHDPRRHPGRRPAHWFWWLLDVWFFLLPVSAGAWLYYLTTALPRLSSYFYLPADAPWYQQAAFWGGLSCLVMTAFGCLIGIDRKARGLKKYAWWLAIMAVPVISYTLCYFYLLRPVSPGTPGRGCSDSSAAGRADGVMTTLWWRRLIKTFYGVVAPWCALAGLLAYVWYSPPRPLPLTAWEKQRLERLDPRAALGYQRTLLANSGRFRVTMDEFDDESAEVVDVAVDGGPLISVFAGESDAGSPRVTVWRGPGYEDPVVRCGAEEGEDFPSFLIVYPQTGPDAGRVAYGDYDMDGRFEKRLNR